MSDSDELLDNPDRVKVLHTMEKEMRSWLRAERRRSGRSVSWMIENAVKQWRERIERGRKGE
jgi:hypothetical protein